MTCPTLVLRITALLLLAASAAGCTRYVTLERLPQAYYQTATPQRDISSSLEEAFRAVRRIQVTGFYGHFRFAPGTGPLEGDPLTSEILAGAEATSTSSSSRAASAVQVAQSGLRGTLLTNEHAVRLPDTIVEYEEVDEERPSDTPRRVSRVSVKRDQFRVVLDGSQGRRLEVLATDSVADLALVGVIYSSDTEDRLLATLPIALGDSDRLSWGSVVYVLGYPGGFPMVTRGMVSDPGRKATSSFLIDGLWNEGTSGGPILAVRGEDESLEWVGLARAAAGKLELQLLPDPDRTPEKTAGTPYTGALYLEEVQRVLYGISFSVPMPTIRRFLDRSRPQLRRAGWSLPVF